MMIASPENPRSHLPTYLPTCLHTNLPTYLRTKADFRQAHDAIEARTGLSPGLRAVHLAVLWFVAEAEGVAVQAMKVYISEEKLMESVLYKSIFEKGETKGRTEGRTEGRAEAHASTLVRLLTHRLGALDPKLREHIRSFGDADTLEAWSEEVFLAADVETVQRVADKIAKSLPA